MAGNIAARLEDLGISLPVPAAPVASYVAYVKTGSLVIVSGQITMGPDGVQYVGKLGEDMTIEEGYRAARLCGINLLAQLNAACDGDLDRVQRVVRLGGFVNCTADFTGHPGVIDGASDLMRQVFGDDAGAHARAAVGCSGLPLGVSVEVEGMFEVA